MASKKILFIQRVHGCGPALAADRGDVEIEVYDGRDPAEIKRRIADADAIVVRTAVIDRAVIDAGRRLAIISRHGVGYDAVDVEAAAERSIPVTITPLANSVSVAEHAMFMLLALAKNARENDAAVRGGWFESARVSMKPVDLTGRNLLIIGFGRIGSRVAPRALGFGMRVHAFDPYVDPSVMEAAGCTVAGDLPAALPEMDAVTVHTPLNDETRGIIGVRELALMKPTALVVNTARGGVVAEDALAAALAGKRIGGAGLDVFESEPAPPRPGHPLLAFDNVIVSPHCAGGNDRVRDADGGVLGAQRARLLRRQAGPGRRRQPAFDAIGGRMNGREHHDEPGDSFAAKLDPARAARVARQDGRRKRRAAPAPQAGMQARTISAGPAGP